jgi:hypothetical protein
MTPAQAREMWPLDEDVDPSIDALAHIYFDHYVWTAKRREPDEDDVASVIELADLMGEGDPLAPEYQRQFDGSSWSVGFDLGQVVIAVVVVVIVVYVALRSLS